MTRWELRSSAQLCSVYWQFLTDDARQPIGPICESEKLIIVPWRQNGQVVPKRRYWTAITCCVIAQRFAGLVYFAEKAWNNATNKLKNIFMLSVEKLHRSQYRLAPVLWSWYWCKDLLNMTYSTRGIGFSCKFYNTRYKTVLTLHILRIPVAHRNAAEISELSVCNTQIYRVVDIGRRIWRQASALNAKWCS